MIQPSPSALQTSVRSSHEEVESLRTVSELQQTFTKVKYVSALHLL